MTALAGKTVFITGASRGIGKAIGLRCASDGANIVIAAKTETPHPTLEGTIHTAAEEMKAAGGDALAVACDVRDADQIVRAVAAAVDAFGGIDVLVNNASALSLTGTLETPLKRYELMHQINVRGTFVCSQTCIPHLRRSDNPHILTLAPPINLERKWLAGHGAYTASKYAMAMLTLGMAEEFRADGIACNTLWPRTSIWTAAMRVNMGEGVKKNCRTTDIVADAAHLILTRPAREFSGHSCIDDEVLAAAGVTDLARYRFAGAREDELWTDLFL